MNMTKEQRREVQDNIIEFLLEYGVGCLNDTINVEKEWVDFHFDIGDEKQMERLNTWLQNDLKSVIKGWSDIQISAPNPMVGKENELRVRIYELN